MPKRSSTRSAKADTIRNAWRVVQESIQQSEVQFSLVASRVMAEMGRKGGRIGGKRRLETLSPERRKEIASQAAKTRWAKKSKRT